MSAAPPGAGTADAAVFSRPAYVWPGLDRAEVIAPSIDVFSPKNQDLAPSMVAEVLGAAGILGTEPADPPAFRRLDGSTGTVSHRAGMIEDEPLPDIAPIVAQVSRWDGLKDPVGVLEGFASGCTGVANVHPVLAGPRTDGVADDPGAGEVFVEVRSAWERLPGEARRRVHLASLPVEDDDENSVVVNALQRRSDVVVQKSLAEGFGLTVAEAMWKGRPVVASRVGGIQDQIVDGESGILLDDPRDLDAFGRAVTELLADHRRADAMGAAARRTVYERFLPTRHLLEWVKLVSSLARD